MGQHPSKDKQVLAHRTKGIKPAMKDSSTNLTLPTTEFDEFLNEIREWTRTLHIAIHSMPDAVVERQVKRIKQYDDADLAPEHRSQLDEWVDDIEFIKCRSASELKSGFDGSNWYMFSPYNKSLIRCSAAEMMIMKTRRTSKKEKCGWCSEELKMGRETNCCSHCYHSACLFKWFDTPSSNFQCPACHSESPFDRSGRYY